MKAVGRQRAGALIELVQKNPILYDRRHKHFRDKDMRDRAWQNIADALKIDRKTIMIAWNSMRDQFRRTIWGKTANKWRDYRHATKMEFLIEHIHHRYPPDDEDDIILSASDDNEDDNAPEDYKDDDDDDEDDYFRNRRLLQGDESSEDNFDDQMGHVENRKNDPFNDIPDNSIAEFPPSPPAQKLPSPPAAKPPTPPVSKRPSPHSSKRPSRAVSKRTSTALPAQAPKQPTANATAHKCEGCSGVKETFDEFFKQALTHMPQQTCSNEQSIDELDRFFLDMSTSVRETDISGIDLLQLKSKMMYHLLQEVTKLKNK